MYVRVCSYCDKISYSASDVGEWLCPYCGRNITDPTGTNKQLILIKFTCPNCKNDCKAYFFNTEKDDNTTCSKCGKNWNVARPKINEFKKE